MQNHLKNEMSPYLRQHAENPVDWYPWGKEAFARAKKEQKPIFLSIGYSTCHWCHVMAKESFEDEKVAEVLNREYISIKVDREERPDIDAVYMTACQAMSGSGGWPLTILMTPEQEPFFAATYLPKTTKYGKPGLLRLLENAAKDWKEDRKKLQEQGIYVAKQLQEFAKHAGGGTKPTTDFLSAAADSLKSRFDTQWGGFGGAPKFPMPHMLLFLMRYAKDEREGSLRRTDVLWMVGKTLDQIYRGGIFDHIGGGISRYSTDDAWLIPHFEKMLYDNALMAYVYAEAGQRMERPFYLRVAVQLLEYMLRELADPSGGFYCGQDADSEGKEGKYYLFSPNEIKARLGARDGEAFCATYGITEKGVFEGKSIPNLIEEEAFEETDVQMEQQRMQLDSYRKTRFDLGTDDKILTAWTSLAIAALAKTARILGWSQASSEGRKAARYLNAAKDAQRFIEENLRWEDGRLLSCWKNGAASQKGILDDFAFYAWALLELYDATLEPEYLKTASEVAEQMRRLFWDCENHGFYMTPHDGERLLFRMKECTDDALPSGNSVAAYVLSRLSRLTGEIKWRELAEQQLRFLAREAESDPSGYCFALLAFMEELDPSSELICTAASSRDAEAFLAFTERITGDVSVLLKTEENKEMLREAAPFTVSYEIPASGASYYLCHDGSCQAPVHTIEHVVEAMNHFPAK